jgi:hypothetical protein
MSIIPEQYLITDPSKLVKGQKLYSLMFGEVIFESLACDTIYCLKTFHRLKWSIKGKHKSNDYRVDLLLFSPFESHERVILVRDDNNSVWKKRVLIKTIENRALVWCVAETIESSKPQDQTTLYDFWKELEPQEEEKEESIPKSQLRGKTIEEIYKLING